MYLTINDYKTLVSDADLDVIIDSSEEIRTTAETTAQEKIKQYLRSRYDVDAIFTATGEARHPLIIEFMVDITLYQLIARLPGRMGADELRSERYNYVIRELEKIARAVIDPGFPLLTSSIEMVISYGSNKKQKY